MNKRTIPTLESLRDWKWWHNSIKDAVLHPRQVLKTPSPYFNCVMGAILWWWWTIVRNWQLNVFCAHKYFQTLSLGPHPTVEMSGDIFLLWLLSRPRGYQSPVTKITTNNCRCKFKYQKYFHQNYKDHWWWQFLSRNLSLVLGGGGDVDAWMARYSCGPLLLQMEHIAWSSR